MIIQTHISYLTTTGRIPREQTRVTILVQFYIPTPYILLVSGDSMDTTINKTHRQDITDISWKVV